MTTRKYCNLLYLYDITHLEYPTKSSTVTALNLAHLATFCRLEGRKQEIDATPLLHTMLNFLADLYCVKYTVQTSRGLTGR